MKHSITIIGNENNVNAFKELLHAHLLSSSTVKSTPVTNLKRIWGWRTLTVEVDKNNGHVGALSACDVVLSNEE